MRKTSRIREKIIIVKINFSFPTESHTHKSRQTVFCANQIINCDCQQSPNDILIFRLIVK